MLKQTVCQSVSTFNRVERANAHTVQVLVVGVDFPDVKYFVGGCRCQTTFQLFGIIAIEKRANLEIQQGGCR